nr:protocadherin Fat 3 isoform X1 [Pelodiscus sinensis]XP_006112265.1 protocadherin Fat 3 isoform X1 [Pelodiscus sinensis]XP_025044455.1 protocadherin Fat 3 isoform X1 [Pelodiscus sinensis]XP_025044460.1 protocadherin Fat 3 isoform X1 [Pelodiscus sinensis]|eukprot:XP_006112264.1 protocadherin Fat 3 isoform X1 [Pelodiscus sinensis]
MEVNMGCWSGTRPPLSYLTLLLVKLLACICQGLQGTIPLGFHFTHSIYNATVYENSAARTYVNSPSRMGITLSDLSWDIKYRIVSGDEEGFFKAEEVIIADFCFLRIRTKGGNSAILNREIQDNYLLIVKGSVRGEDLEAWTKVNIQVLDMNDLRPLFSPTTYSVTIAESTPLRTSIAQVTATDADIGSNGEFYYYFKNKVDLFSVHPTSGVISLSGRLNYDEKNRYDLEVLAVDRGMKLYGNNGVSSTAKLYVHIERINEHAPTINVVTHIPFPLDKEPTYAVINIDDLDEGANGEIESVSIVAGDPLEQFLLAKEGKWMNEYKIKERKPIDWDSFPYGYNLTLQAKDKGSPQKFSAVKLVHIASPKRESVPAKFEKEVYDVSISEISPPGVVVAIVKLVPEPQGVEYKISPNQDAEYFKINPRTGLIVTACPLKIIENELYELEVVNKGGDLKAQVIVRLEDANDHIPEFTQPSYSSFVNESVPVGTSILSVSAFDKDRGENGYITYSIASLNSLPFTINQFTGVISTSEELDFESSPESYRFIVRASDWGSPYRHESEVNVTIYIGNVNDNKPLFEKVACQGVISSDFPIGGHITAVSAIDIDELELVKYKIISGNDLGIFYLNPDSGVLQLKKSLVNSGIKNSNFGLRITATDGENFADAMFVNISVVHGKVSSKTFSCRETRVAQKLAEKLLKKAKANMKLNLEDGFLDFYSINRQAPYFDKSFPSDVTVREDLPVGASILKIKAYDVDSGFNGKVIYTISDGNTDSCFNIDMETGLLKVLMPMDREKTELYLLNITIYDLGNPQKSTWRLLTVTVEDANDNSPVFLQDSYSVNILESTSIGTEIIQVEARDKDLGSSGEVSYSVLTDTQQFAINSSTGVVYVSDQLDRESKANYTLKIEARDKSENGHQQFSVVPLKVFLDDVNDCSPTFIPSSYSVKVLEDLPVGTVIAWLETQDPDLGLGGQVRYSLVNDYNGRFEIDKASGTIRLNKELDYEKQQFYNLTVRAKDKGRPVSLSSVSFVEVEVVDVNENLYTPYFPDFAVIGSVKENARVGTSVLQVTARDEDSGRDGEIQYSIRDGSGLGRFSIDEETGVIYTADVLDRETTKSYWLTVYATDRGVVPLYTTIEVYVEVDDVNDNAPLTSEPIYYPAVTENSPKDVSVIQIQAQDPDSITNEKLTYRITSGNPQNFFAINPKTGLITTTSRKLDREQQAEHFLEVTVTDGGISPKQSTIWVVVQVLDENDNKPQFPEKVYQVKLPERDRKKRGEPIYRAFAFDKDEGPNAEISYSIVDGNDDGKFFIDPKTGMVSSRKQFTAGNYDILTIKAVDNGRPQKSSTARLHIEWIKKPAPSPVSLTFDEPFYNFTVMESDRVTEIVGVVSVQPSNIPLWFDIVGGKHAREMFYILQTACGQNCSTEGGNFDSSFDAEKGAGTIVIAKPLDAEQRSIYNMTVEVTDGTNVATTQVFIRVLDNNDNGPEFSQPSYDVTISEDILPDTEILQVEAIDRDEKHKLSYTIHSSIDSVSMRKFRIDASTGVLYTAERLDHEAQDKHILNVMVRDQEFPYRRNLARVVINVEDSNDHSPYFTSPLYEASVYESAAIGSAVLQVTALDKDKGENAELIYTIEAGNTGNTFKIEPVLGIITVLKEPDLTTMGQFVLSVKVTDQGSPPLSATAIVRISVTMSDNSHPKFAHKEYQAEVNENVDIGTSVILISAISQSTLVYEVKDGNVDGAFTINPYSGVITSQKALDYERTSSYQLIVQATNMAGMASNATVNIQIVDENDNLPVFLFSQYSGSISEAAPLNSIVRNSANNPLVIRATDADSNQNALLVYQIVESTAKNYFTVDSSTGAIRTISNLDHETIAHFHFHVHVRDSGNPQLTAESPVEVTIEVTDINDNPPVFSQAVFETVLLLPTYFGVEVLKVKATDPDSGVPPELMYSLIEGNVDHFLIDSNTGVLTIKNNTLSKDHYMLTVRVSDGKFYSTAVVTIMVKEAMDSGLHFTQSFYSTSISENSTNITKVAVVNAVGNRLNEPLKYGILNPGNKFKIKSTSGLIETTGIPFDREKQELYELVVEASRELDHLRVARVVVRVNIEDINDNAPVFVGLPYYAAVQVDAEPGALIYRVTAIDKDKGANGEVSYLLKEDYGHFEIDRQTGSVTLREAFNSDLSNIEYLVIILAKDGGNPSLSASVELPITIVNKAMPVFDKPFYTASVNEDVEMHTPILSINATSPEGQGIIYIIVDGDPYNQFNIEFDTGVLSVISPLDYEVNSVFKLTVRASDALTGARAEVTVDLIINDVNDNPPVFDHSTYNATLSEASLIGTPVLQVVAADADSENNKIIQYQIVQDSFNSTDYFHIDSTSGLILTARMLDHELLQQCSLKVRATDNGFPPLSSEVLVSIYVTDMNDNPPVFNQLIYESYVSELAPRGHFVTCVQASDADSSDFDRLEYSILSGNDRTSFIMDSKSGIITLSNHRKQRMEPMYSLNVSVSDGLFTSTAQVHIRILGANLYSPVFSQSIYMSEVRENAAPGTKVIHVKATDGDSGIYGQINYSIINDFAKDRFFIDNNGQILTTEKLDRENPLEGDISIFLRALDGGGRMTFCTVRVIVVDENDNTPQFMTIEYRASVKADVGKGHLVTQVQALDPDDGVNSRITYSLYSEASVSVADLLEIDPDNGWMVTKGNFNQLKNTVLSFFVKAVDGGIPMKHSLIPVYIHVLPPEAVLPSFSQPQYSFIIPEDSVIGKTLDILHILPSQDAMYSTVNGELAENNKEGIFIIDQDTGIIKLDKRLDHETNPAFHFKVAATIQLDKVDIVLTVDVEIKVLDVNDNKPVFEAASYEAVIMEGMPIGINLIQVKAIDADSGANGQVTYTLAAESELDKVMETFTIDSNSGWISTLKDLDHEKNPAFTFAVVASDLGEAFSLSSTTLVSVTVTDINDNAPVFEHGVYRGSVKESDPPGEVVAVLSTWDEDTSEVNRQVSYHITGGNPKGKFALGLVQNEWKVYVKRPLDREEQDFYFLNITATDGLFVTQAAVEVIVTDVNDNSPVCDQFAYTALFPEDIPSNKVILKISAKDADIGSSGEIRYSLFGPGNNKFFLDPESGELKTLALLDREKIPVYNLIARATDGGGRFCQSEIHLVLQDVNDNPPMFSTDHYTACVYENTATKALLTRVQATDPDVGVNRKVVYSLVDSADGYFSVDRSSGIIILEHPLDRELQPSYNITVKASDQSIGLTLSSFATVTITVLDINDNPPVFERRDYLVTVPEDTSPGTKVIAVFATSKDIGTNAEITYLIRSGNEKGKFRINSKTGSISVIEALDYEMCKDFYLIVEAKDGGMPALSAVTTVNINVTDVNDNAPKFNQEAYSAVISEDAAVADSVIMLIAEDQDSPTNGQIHFSIVNGDRDNEFSVDSVLGLIKVKKKLDRERVSGYSLVIQARDSGIPPLSSSVTVNIDISDVNDNSPVFTPANYTAVIQENKPVGTSILQLVVTDNDSFHNGPPFTFTILTGNEEEEFMLDPHGVLRSAVIFKHMVATEYVLCVQAKDSGKPQQVSQTYIQVRVIEESIHKPTAIPLEIFIITMEDDFPGGVIGKIHATDQDVYDVLTYTLKSEQKSLFKVNSHDGKIIALGGLDNGKYILNVSVSDGRFQVPIDVIVHVEQLVQEMLQNTVTIRFEKVSPEDFVGLHMHGFRRTLRNAVVSQKQDSLHIISIQPVAGTSQLDMLFAVQMHNSGFYKPAYLIQKLTNARRHLENVIRISAILEKNCSGLDCQEQHCEQSLSIDSHSLMTYSTARISFVCPRFYRNVRCTCNGGLCPGSNDPCMEKPCPGDMQCVGYEASRRPFICQCPPGKLGECSGHTSLSFAGNSYIKYRVSENSKKEEFKLALRLRTLQSNGIIMYTRANPCIILKIVDGKLWFQLDCGSGPGILGISGRTVNDGNWHSVFLELNRNFTSLSLDDSYVERRKAPLYFQTLSTDSSVYFGAQVQVDNVRSLTDKRTTQVLSGFQGCLDSVVLNNNELPLQNKRSSFAEVVGLTELKLGCVLYPDACERNPCQNGGSCTSLPSGGYQCSCLSQFTGRNCESEITACFPNPCRNGGSCDPIGNAFICNCRSGLTGVTCEDDVNECEREECENGGSCVNVFGSFLCNCTPGYVGQYCGLRPVVVPNIQAGHSYVGKEELIGIAVVLFVIFVLIILFIVFRKKVFRKNYSRNNITLVQDPATAALLNKSNGIQFKNLRNSGDSRNIYQEVGPPQVPVRPMAYTPCFQSESRNNLDKIVDGLGIEHQEMTTFHPESPRILTARRGVVVCSVAPNLPAVSPCRSDCDSIRKSTWDGGTESKEVDDAEEVTCFAGSNKGSNSEVQSLSSFQSDSGDDNASIVTVIQLVNNVVDTIENEVSVMDQGQNYNRAYHWDTSDWMPSARLSDIEEVPNYETADGGSVHHGSNRELETDYYLGGYDIDSDYPPPHEEEFLSQDQLPPPLPEDYPDQYATLPPSQPVSIASTLSPDCRRRPQFHPSQYLPPHQFPNEMDTAGSQTVNEFSTFAVVPGQSAENVSAGKLPLSLHNSLDASSSDISAGCGFDDSEVAMSDFESVEELILDKVHIPFVETQHQTQV